MTSEISRQRRTSKAMPKYVCLPFVLTTLVAFYHPASPTWAGEKTEVSVDRILYERDVAPILQQNCIACHRKGQSEGGLNLEDKKGFSQGGDSGPVLSNEDPKASLLLARLNDDSDPMPPEDNTVGAKRLTRKEVKQIADWISQGASFESSDSANHQTWHPIPDSIRSTYAMALSPDGQTAAVAHANRVQLRDATTGKLTQTLSDPALQQLGVVDVDFVQSLAFSPMGDRLATGGFRSVRLWKRRPVEKVLPQHFARLDGITTFSPNRLQFATVNAIGDVEITAIGSEKNHLTIASSSKVRDISWAHQDSLVIGYSSGKVARVQTIDGKILHSQILEGAIAEISQSITGDSYAARLATGHIVVFKQDQPVSLEAISPIADSTAIVWVGDQQFCFATPSGKASLVSLDTGKTVRQFDAGAPITTLNVELATKTIAVGTRDATTKLFHTDDGKLLHTLNAGPETSLRLAMLDQHATREQARVDRLGKRSEELKKQLEAEDAALAKVAETQKKASEEVAAEETKLKEVAQQIGDAEKQIAEAKAAIAEAEKRIAQQTAAIENHRKTENALKQTLETKRQALAKRNQALVTAKKTRDQAATKIPAHSAVLKRLANEVQDYRQRRDSLQSQVAGHDSVRAIAFAPNTSQLVTVHATGIVKTYARVSGKPLATTSLPSTIPAETTLHAFFTDNDVVLVASSGRKPQSVSTTWTWELERTVGGMNSNLISDRVTALDFHHSGQTLAIGSGAPSRTGEVLIVASDSGRVLRRYDQLHSDTVFSVRFSPDGNLLATSSADKTIRIVDVQSGNVRKALDGHTHHVMAVCWSADGQRVASASADQTVKIWEIESGRQLRTIGGFPDEVTAIAFLPGTSRVVSACSDGNIRIHDFNNGSLFRQAGASGDFLYTLGVLPGKSHVLAAGQKGTVHRWNSEDGKQIDQWD